MASIIESSIVYFRFQGEDDAHNITISIPKQHLQKDVRDSLLAKLADKTWKDDPTSGSSKALAILVYPLKDPYNQVWSSPMATLIVQAYKYISSSNKNTTGPEPRLVLPPEVELEDALDVLDHYGLTLDPPCFQLDKSSDVIQIRANIFLKQAEHMEKAKDFIIQMLKTSSRRCNYFVFAGVQDDWDFITKCVRSSKLFRVGGDDLCDEHCEWVEEERLRQNIITLLEETGLEANFVTGTSILENYNDENYPQIEEETCPAGKCWLTIAEYGGGYVYDRVEGRYALRVDVPKAPKKRRAF